MLRPIEFLWHSALQDYITSVAWSPNGSQLAVGSVSGEAAVYSASGERRHHWPQVHEEGVDALAWRPDGQALVTAGRDGTWKMWDVTTGQKLVEHAPGGLWIEHAAWSSQHKLLAIGGGNKVTLWNEQGEPAAEPITLPRAVAEIAWIMAESTLAIAFSTGLSLRDSAGKEERFFAAKDPILSFAFNPSGKWLVTGTQDNAVHVWNTDSGAEMHMRGYPAKVRQLAWHRGGRWLAAGGGESVAVWDCSGRGPEGRQPIMLEWHHDQIRALHYQPGGDWLASGAEDGGVAVWSPTQRQQLITAGKISNGVTRVAWSPDGKKLAATGSEGAVQMLGVG